MLSPKFNRRDLSSFHVLCLLAFFPRDASQVHVVEMTVCYGSTHGSISYFVIAFVGTLRPDLIESASKTASKHSEAIKTHHNDTEFVRELRGKVFG